MPKKLKNEMWAILSASGRRRLWEPQVNHPAPAEHGGHRRSYSPRTLAFPAGKPGGPLPGGRRPLEVCYPPPRGSGAPVPPAFSGAAMALHAG